MNLISYVLLFLIAMAVGYGFYKTVKRKGRCTCCDGTCPGCREACKEEPKKDGEKK